MNIPLILFIVLYAIALLSAANSHGKEKEGKNNFWYAMVAVCIQWGLLWAAGIFKLL